ncbi:T9SS type A sorting domain-containing protein [Flavobacterium soli]|uniref:T9SS type A sorting domain-containing protein n=1 Tax=Flavobacterium soli TaxID=344881 RepID=UPI0004135039|nr:PKD domain-containing protein [Flavobacterium soli]
MEQHPFPRQKLFLALTFFALFFMGIFSSHAQTPPGVGLFWDSQVGCQIGIPDDKRFKFLEDIEESECLRVCDLSEVNYELFYLPAGATTTWSVVGGTLLTSANDGCTVLWENVGMGSISMTIALPGSTISKTLCIEKMELPTALFEIPNQTAPDHFVTCSDQLINFTNLSFPNTGSSLIGYFWDFGDGTSSTAFEPTHTYAHEGEYKVRLTVTNACNCKATFEMKVFARRRGFEILCPTVVCEGQSALYTLPFDGVQVCNGNYNWSVVGGQIISQGNGTVEVLWNNVDELGFGYVTFDPQNCDLPCLEPSTIKVPVVLSKGTIQGPTELCLREQARYKLPQWPTTDVQWEIVGNTNNDLAEIMLTDQRNEIIVVPLVPGTLTLRAVYTNTLLGCSGQAEFTISVAPPLEIIGEGNFCENSSGSFTNSANAVVTWILTDDSDAVVATATGTTFNYIFSEPGNYSLAVEAPDFCSADEKSITVIALPEKPDGLNGDTEVCPNAPYPYSVQNPDPNSTYSWMVTNGTVLGSSDGEEVNITFNGTFPATVAVYRKTISPVECVSEPEIIAVQQVPVNAAITASQGSTVCASSIASYKAVQNGTSSLFTDGDSYTWTLSDPTLGSVIDGQGTNEIDVMWNEVSAPTVVTLTLTISKCTLNPAPQFTMQVTINPKTLIQILASENPICAGPLYTVTYTVAATNGVPLSSSDVVTWNLGNGTYTTAAGVFSQSRTFNNTSGTNIDVLITAVIANANGCGTSNTAVWTTTVLPNPPAIATLTSGGNTFCNASEVNSVLTVSSNTTGVLIQWYRNGVLLPGETGTSLTVTSALNFGNYTFRATNPNGCIAVSNVMTIYQQCGTAPGCTTNGVVQNNASLTACGTITLSATATPAPISSEWKVLGTGSENYSISGNILTGAPGLYTLIFEAVYPCVEGGVTKKWESKQVIIPYAPDFSYMTECNANNTFNVNFIDNSNFYAGVSSPQVRFYYKTAGAASFTGPVTYNSSLSVFEIQNLAAGSYVFKVENEGIAPNTTTFVCSKEYTVNLQGINAFTSIDVNGGAAVGCHDTSVNFGLNINPPLGSSVLWDFGDGATNSAVTTRRVFSTPDTTYTITCTITNALGCSLVLNSSVYIPKKCFFGDVVAMPADASVCKNEAVLLQYVPEDDNCIVASYTWMNENEPVAGAGNTNTLSVTSPGFYWVKVNSSNGCTYNTPTRITPEFKPLPGIKIQGQARYCENDPIILTAVTNATSIQWAIDGSVQSQFNNMTVADFSGMFSPANFVISCTVTEGGCSNIALHNITIEESIVDILVDISIQCDPYHVVITAQAVTYSGNPAHYNWSNGEVGETIEVSDGGVFSVTATTGGGCTFTKQIDVPRSPENYMWIFPSGCYTDCIRVGNYLIGPLLPLDSWSWNLDGQADVSGGGYADPYTLNTDGEYSLTINTGVCDLESDVLDFSTERCEKCKIEGVDIKDVVRNETKYCSFTQTIVIYSGYSQPFQVTLSDQGGNVTIIPSSFTLVPGQNIIQVTVIPQSPFMGGMTSWRLHGQVLDRDTYIDCEYVFQIDIPYCDDVQSRPTASSDGSTPSFTTSNCSLSPNPTSGTVQLHYDLGVAESTVELYDLTGRMLIQKDLTANKGTETLDISNYADGMYIVVLKNGNEILYQQKLIIK